MLYTLFSLPLNVLAVAIQEDKPKESKIRKKNEYFHCFPRKTISELFDVSEVTYIFSSLNITLYQIK